MVKADSWVDSSTIWGAISESWASTHLERQRHQRSPSFRPENPGMEVLRSLPAPFENARKTSVMTTQATCRPKSRLSVLQQPSRSQPVIGSIEHGSSLFPRTFIDSSMFYFSRSSRRFSIIVKANAALSLREKSDSSFSSSDCIFFDDSGSSLARRLASRIWASLIQ